MNVWFYIGIALLLWVVYDLVTGKVWSYREIERKNEPAMYWVFILAWFVLAATSISYGLYY